MRVFVSESAHIRRLASDMLLVAIRDLKDPKLTLDAALFLVSVEFKFYAEILGIPYADPVKAFMVLGPVHAGELAKQIKNIKRGEGFDPREVKILREEVLPLLQVIVNKKKRGKTEKLYTRPRGRERKHNDFTVT